MLSYVIAKLDRLEEILEEVGKLARRHSQYGVQDAHYDAVGEALLWTLQTGLGEHWNDTVKLALIEVYEEVSRAMIAAQNDERMHLATAPVS